MFLAAACLYNVYRLDQPWLRLVQAWTLGVIVNLFAPMVGGESHRRGVVEDCAHFLEKQHEERRIGFLRLRDRIFLFLPGVAASWWGGGAAPWLFGVTGAGLVLLWMLCGEAAKKAGRDRDEVRPKGDRRIFAAATKNASVPFSGYSIREWSRMAG
jgi:hypothetical protein